MKKTKQSDKKKDIKRSHLIELGATVLIIVFANLIGHYFFGRLDLTAEKRYTISKSTKRLLKGLDEPVLFRVYLEGNLTADYQRLQNETREMLNQFRAYSKYVNYEFVNPNEIKNKEEQQQFFQKLAKKGIQPSYLQVKTTNGVEQQIVFPAADVNYKGHETSIQLMQNLSNFLSADMALNNSVQNLEYVLSNAIRGLARVVKPKIGFTYGHGELDNRDMYDILMSLYDNYTLENVNLTEDINVLTGRSLGSDSTIHLANKYDVLVVAKPRQAFSDQELYILDQYLMYGGKALWLIDPLDADLDSLQNKDQAIVTRFPLNLDEMFFNYGVRVNADLIEDVRCRPIPLTVGMAGDKPQIALRPWFYFPDLVPTSKHPIVKNLDLIKTDFVSSIDLVENTSSQDVDKTVLLTTSEYCRVKNAPVIIDLNEARTDINQLDQRLFNKRNLPVAVLLEGTFQSMWRNRLAPEFTQLPEMGYRDTSERTKMIVVSDGDVIKNRINYKEGFPYPLGFDLYTNTMYANRQFLLNAIDYLAGDEEGMATRVHDVTMRKLNTMKASKGRACYQALNVVLPASLILLLVPMVLLIRQKRYLKK
ncbi:MAG: gliding motility-associated ABC transporter substrate-binding protein GldG [Bacteroidales bacterium]|nr:gliding motility-associated ABC transporter substrate-binding protein GldG [Bacteroidales bacterium]